MLEFLGLKYMDVGASRIFAHKVFQSDAALICRAAKHQQSSQAAEPDVAKRAKQARKDRNIQMHGKWRSRVAAGASPLPCPQPL